MKIFNLSDQLALRKLFIEVAAPCSDGVLAAKMHLEMHSVLVRLLTGARP